MRSVERVEAEWDAESYGLLAALADYEGSLCPRCGQPLDECMDPNADRDNPRGTHVYVPKVVGRCHACDATMRAQEPFRGEDAPPRVGAYHFTAERQPRPQRT